MTNEECDYMAALEKERDELRDRNGYLAEREARWRGCAGRLALLVQGECLPLQGSALEEFDRLKEEEK